MTQSMRERSAFTGIKHVRVVWAMIISSMLIQAATTSINPIAISLFVKELMHNHGNIAMVSGGWSQRYQESSNLIAAPQLGALGDHIGPRKVLVAGLIFVQ